MEEFTSWQFDFEFYWLLACSLCSSIVLLCLLIRIPTSKVIRIVRQALTEWYHLQDHTIFLLRIFRLIIRLLCYKGTTIQAVTAKILSWLKFGHSEKATKIKNGLFNLHLLDFTFINQFYFRKTILVESIFWNPVGLFGFMSFHNHFKLFWYCVLIKMRGIFCPPLFWDTAKRQLNW